MTSKGFVGAMAVAILLIIIVVGIIAATVNIGPGYVGVLYDRTLRADDEKVLLVNGQPVAGVHDEVFAGFIWTNPITQRVIRYPIEVQTLYLTKNEMEGSPADESFLLPTREGLNVSVDVVTSIGIIPEMTPTLYARFRADRHSIEQGFVRSNIKTVAQNISGRYSVLEMYGPKREEVAVEILDALNSVFNPFGITCEAFSFGEVRLPENVEREVQHKIEATQQAERAQADLERIRIEREQRIVQASAQADAIRLEAEAQAEANRLIAESLTPDLVKLKGYETLNPNISIMLVPNEGLWSFKDFLMDIPH